MKQFPIPVGVAVSLSVALLITAAISSKAQQKSALHPQFSSSFAPPNGGTDGDVPGPCGDTTLTQNTDPNTITPLNSIACNLAGVTSENGYAREFTAPAGPGFEIQCVDIGVETNIGPDFDVTVNIYTGTLPGPVSGLTLLASRTVAIPANSGAQIYKAAFQTGGSPVIVAGGANFVVEVFTPDRTVSEGGDGGGLFIGSNAAGQSGPSYIRAVGCATPDFTDLADLGFPSMHIVMRVDGGTPTGFPLDLAGAKQNWNTVYGSNVTFLDWTDLGVMNTAAKRDAAVAEMTDPDSVYVVSGDPNTPATITAVPLSGFSPAIQAEWAAEVDAAVAIGQHKIQIDWEFVGGGGAFSSICVATKDTTDSIKWDSMLVTLIVPEQFANGAPASVASGSASFYWAWPFNNSVRGRATWSVTCHAHPPICTHDCQAWMTLGDAQIMCTEEIVGNNCKLHYGYGIRTPTGSITIVWNPATLQFDVTITGLGSNMQGNGSILDPCPKGSCCVTGGGCTDGMGWDECGTLGGVYNGDNSSCADNLCSSPSCPADIAPPGGDGTVGVPDLLAVINTWGPCGSGPGGICAPYCHTDFDQSCSVGVFDLLVTINNWGPCQVAHFGACCFPGGGCQELEQQQCVDLGGLFSGPDTVCTPTLCSGPVGACCFPGGVCEQLPEQQCVQNGGQFLGPIPCQPGTCAP